MEEPGPYTDPKMTQQKACAAPLLSEPDPFATQAVQMLTDYTRRLEINSVDFAILCILKQREI